MKTVKINGKSGTVYMSVDNLGNVLNRPDWSEYDDDRKLNLVGSATAFDIMQGRFDDIEWQVVPTIGKQAAISFVLDAISQCARMKDVHENIANLRLLNESESEDFNELLLTLGYDVKLCYLMIEGAES